MGCLGFRIFRTEPGSGPWDRLERRKYSRSDNSVEKIYDRTEVLLPGRAVPRCHGCVETKQKTGIVPTKNRKPNHPIPTFVTKFSSFCCFFAKRGLPEEGDHHCRARSPTPPGPRSSVRCSSYRLGSFSNFVFSLPFLCFNKCGRGKRDFPVSFCSFDEYATWASDCLYLTTTTTTRRRRNTNKRAVALLNYAVFFFCF